MKKKAHLYERHPFQVRVEGTLIQGEAFNPFQGGSSHPTLVLCHGIPSGESGVAQGKKGYHFWGRFLARRGYPVVIFNFRGTGASHGNLNLKEWPLDLQAVLNGYVADINPEIPGFVLIGFSAGAATAVETASEDMRVKGTALAACPADFQFFFERFSLEEAVEWMKTVGLFRDKDYPLHKESWQEDFLSIRPVEKINLLSPRPLLLLHGELDELVPLEHASRLYERAGEPCQLITFPRLHHQLRRYPRIFGIILEWLNNNFKEKGY